MKALQFAIAFFTLLILVSCGGSKLTSNDTYNPRQKQKADPDAWESDWVDEEKTEDVAEAEPPAPSYFGVDWAESQMLKPLLGQAKAEGKLVFIDFYASWCAPCKVMDKNVFAEKRMGDFMNENFISYKADVDVSHLSALYEVKSLPTLLFLDTEGEVLVRKDGSAGFNEFMKLGEKALNMMNMTAGGGR